MSRDPRGNAKSSRRLSCSAHAPLDLLLPVLPFTDVSQPVIGVSILKALAIEAGFTSKVKYYNLQFAEQIGLNLSRCIASFFGSVSMIGDWIFAEALYGSQVAKPDYYWRQLRAEYSRHEDGVYYGVKFSGGRSFSQYVEQELWPEILKVREAATQAVGQWVVDILAQRPRVVGFTSSCHQACSTLAVARRLKRELASPIIVFGGPNCHEELGLNWLRCFPWIDYVCTGEAEHAFAEFLNQIIGGTNVVSIPGFLSRGDDPLSVPLPLADLDLSPIPNYGDYFRQRRLSPLGRHLGNPVLPLETSRGCWWGERCQCTFCGNTRTGIAYRSKSPARVLREVKILAKTHQSRYFITVDDVLDKRQISPVFGKLSRNGARFRFVYQTRADLRRDELATLFRAGVRTIQPGIESFSDEVLRLMRKGTTGLSNLQSLRWAQEVGMHVSWRILYGFPGEAISEYERMTKMLPLLTHLNPPLGAVMIALKRFSPHWMDTEHFGFSNVRPCPAYSMTFPLEDEKLRSIATHFSFSYADGRDPFTYTRPLRIQIGKWIELWQSSKKDRPKLEARWRAGDLFVVDTRPCAERRHHRLTGLAAKVYLKCDKVQDIAALERALHDEASETQVSDTVAILRQSKLVVEDKGKYLSLALFRNGEWSSTATEFRMH